MNLLKLTPTERLKLERGFAAIINANCLENASNTPDFVLAYHVVEALINFTKTTELRTGYYSRDDDGGTSDAEALASAGFGTNEDYGGDVERI